MTEQGVPVYPTNYGEELHKLVERAVIAWENEDVVDVLTTMIDEADFSYEVYNDLPALCEAILEGKSEQRNDDLMAAEADEEYAVDLADEEELEAARWREIERLAAKQEEYENAQLPILEAQLERMAKLKKMLDSTLDDEDEE